MTTQEARNLIFGKTGLRRLQQFAGTLSQGILRVGVIVIKTEMRHVPGCTQGSDDLQALKVPKSICVIMRQDKHTSKYVPVSFLASAWNDENQGSATPLRGCSVPYQFSLPE